MGGARVAAVAIAAAVVLSVCCSRNAPERPAAEFLPARASLLDHLPRDPLAILWLAAPDPAAAFEAFMGLGRPSLRDDVAGQIRDDLLTRCGPGIALLLDAPVLDELMALTMRGSPDVAQRALLGSGVLVETEQPAALDGALARMFREAGSRIAAAAGVRSARLPVPVMIATAIPTLPPGDVTAYWASADGVLAFGFDPDWVRRSLRARPTGQRLRDGDDFGRVFPALDSELASLAYVNLPRLRVVVEGSTMAQLALAGAPVWKGLWDDLTRRLDSGGLGRLTLRAGGPTVRTTNAPTWMAGFEEFVEVLSTVVLPRPPRDSERWRRLTTLRGLRRTGAAIEDYRLDHRRYPDADSFDGLEMLVTTGYLDTLPARDGWGNPVRGVSSATGYALCSGGTDGGDCSDGAILLSNGVSPRRP